MIPNSNLWRLFLNLDGFTQLVSLFLFPSSPKKQEKQPENQFKNRVGQGTKKGCLAKDSLYVLNEILPSEVVETNIFFWNSPLVAHVNYGVVHHGRSTEVEFDIFWRFVFFQVLIDYN